MSKNIDKKLTPSIDKKIKKNFFEDFGMVSKKKINDNELILNFKVYINQSIDKYLNMDPNSNEYVNLGKILKDTIYYNERLQKIYMKKCSSSDSE